jgi:hypothetical protein
MAELFIKPATEMCDFGCYSERGIMSYFMFVHLPTRIGDFLTRLEFADGGDSPFAQVSSSTAKATIFSELDFGNEGFGKPDGAVYIECPEPRMLLIEVKLSETYAQSCRITKENKYNSTIKGQLELKWRLTESLGEKYHQHEGHSYIRETPAMKAVYGTQDRFYTAESRLNESNHGSWRRLKVVDGVKGFLEYLNRCDDRIYFCAITNDATNPFNDANNSKNMPCCGNLPWEDAKKRFCWLPSTVLTQAGNIQSVLECDHDRT